MGSPQEPSRALREALHKAAEPSALEGPRAVEVRDGKVALRFTMPRQSVSLLRLEW
jgi:xylan 1,4-beta-xylosidase